MQRSPDTPVNRASIDSADSLDRIEKLMERLSTSTEELSQSSKELSKSSKTIERYTAMLIVLTILLLVFTFAGMSFPADFPLWARVLTLLIIFVMVVKAFPLKK